MNGDAGKVIEVFYRDDDYEVWVRKAKATEGLVDISGDDGEYGASPKTGQSEQSGCLFYFPIFSLFFNGYSDFPKPYTLAG